MTWSLLTSHGVGAIMRVASPLFHTGTPQVILESAISGTTRILDADLAAGVKQLIFTTSISSLVLPGDLWKEITVSEKLYNLLTIEDALQHGTSAVFMYSVSMAIVDLVVHNSLETGMNWVIYEPINGAPDRPLSVHNPAI